MALTVEELQIVLSCDATTAQAVLEKMDATVKAYTQKFQNYFNTMGGKGGGSKAGSGLDNVGKNATNAAKRVKDLSNSLRDMERNEYKVGKILSNSDISSKINEGMKSWANKDMYKNAAKEVEELYNEMFGPSPGKTNTANWIPGGGGEQLFNLADTISTRLQNSVGGVDSIPDTLKYKIESVIQTINELRDAYQKALDTNGAEDKGTIALQKKFETAVFAADGYIRKLDQIAYKEQEAEQASMDVGYAPSRFQRILGLISSIRSAASSAGSSIRKAFSHTLLGRFIKRLGSVLMRMAAMKLIRGTIQGVKEGLEMLANAGGTAGQAMNSIKASTNAVKAALGVALMPVVKALAPIFYQLAGAVAAAANMIARFFAILTGQSSYTTAVIADNMDNVSSSVGGAGSAVKGMLADFDELNVLTKNSGGGGGGGANSGYANFVDEQLGGASGGLAERLRKAFLGQDWETLGKELGNAINSIFSEERFAEIGANIGKKVNALFTTTYWTLNSTNFQNIGGSIATFLSNALSNIDFSKLGGIVATKFTVLPEIIIGAINKLDFGAVGRSLGDFLKGAIQHFKKFIDRVDWGETAWNLIKGLIDAIVGLDVPGIAADLLSFAGTIISAVINGLGTLLLDIADVLTDPNTWRLVKAWLQDLPTVIKSYAIKAANALVKPIVDKLNDLINKYNSSWFGEHFGKIDPISFELIPEIPKEELTRNYDNAKKYIEAKNATDAIKLKFQAQVEKKIKFKELFENFFKPSSNKAEVEVAPEVKEPAGTSKIFGANSGVTSGGGKTNLILGVIPTLGNRSVFVNDMDKNVVRKNNPWSALTDAVMHDWSHVTKYMGSHVERHNNPWGAWTDAVMHDWSNVTKYMGSHVERHSNPWGAWTDAVMHDWSNVNKYMASRVERHSNPWGAWTDAVMHDWSNVTTNMEKHVTRKSSPWQAVVDPKLNNTKQYIKDMGGLTEEKTVKIKPELKDAKAFKEQLQSTLKASASIKTTVAGSTKTIGKVSMSEYAQGGLAYGMTSAIIGEYAGARNNPEVVAPLNKLQGILEHSNTGGNKDTMTREQANTMIGLLKELTKKETVVRPSVELGQVVDRSLKAYART